MSCGICYNKKKILTPCKCSFNICIDCLNRCHQCPQCRRTYGYSNDWILFDHFRYYYNFQNIVNSNRYIDCIVIDACKRYIITMFKGPNNNYIRKRTFTSEDNGKFIILTSEPSKLLLYKSYKHILKSKKIINNINNNEILELNRIIKNEDLPTIQENVTQIIEDIKENKINSPKNTFQDKKNKKDSWIKNRLTNIKIHTFENTNENTQVERVRNNEQPNIERNNIRIVAPIRNIRFNNYLVNEIHPNIIRNPELQRSIKRSNVLRNKRNRGERIKNLITKRNSYHINNNITNTRIAFIDDEYADSETETNNIISNDSNQTNNYSNKKSYRCVIC